MCQPNTIGSSGFGLTLSIHQYCVDWEPLTSFVDFPFSTSPDWHAQKCIPTSTTDYESFPYDWVDLNDNGRVDSDPEEVVKAAAETCSLNKVNCNGESVSYCDDADGTMTIGVLGSRMSKDYLNLDPVCQLSLTNNGGVSDVPKPPATVGLSSSGVCLMPVLYTCLMVAFQMFLIAW